MVLACLAMSMADLTLVILAMLTWTGLSEPDSLSLPRCSASSWERYRSAAIQLSLACVSWKAAIGLPNCPRVQGYSIALSRQVLAAPVTPPAMPNRASVRHDSGPLSPETPGNTASAGSRTSSRCNSDVMDARRDSFLWMSLAVKPAVPRGTRNPRMPSEVPAHTTAMSAMLPLVIHILVPESTQSDPSRLANVCMLPGSEPLSGSVRPKQPMASPAAIRGSHSFFCSSEPNRQIGDMASEPWTEVALRSPESHASSSRQATPEATDPVPPQPYPVRCMPRTPSLPSSGMISDGSMPASNQSVMCGSTRSAVNARTVSRMSRSSSVSWSSICSRSVCGVPGDMAGSSLCAPDQSIDRAFDMTARPRSRLGVWLDLWAWCSAGHGSLAPRSRSGCSGVLRSRRLRPLRLDQPEAQVGPAHGEHGGCGQAHEAR